MTFEDEDLPEVIEIDDQDWIEEGFKCPNCGSHILVQCLGGQVVYTVVDKIKYIPEKYIDDQEYDGDESEDEDEEPEVEVAHACVSLQSGPDGSDIWDYGVDDANDSYSWFHCFKCRYVPRFKDGSAVEDETELATWLINPHKRSQ